MVAAALPIRGCGDARGRARPCGERVCAASPGDDTFTTPGTTTASSDTDAHVTTSTRCSRGRHSALDRWRAGRVGDLGRVAVAAECGAKEELSLGRDLIRRTTGLQEGSKAVGQSSVSTLRHVVPLRSRSFLVTLAPPTTLTCTPLLSAQCG